MKSKLPLQPPTEPRPRRGLVLALPALALALVAIMIVRRPSLHHTTGAQRARAASEGTATAPKLAGHPEWPRSGDSGSYQPATARFPDGSLAVLYPDRVRSAWGRPLRISVERFDPSGKPMIGIRDMELVIETPGQPPFKAGFTEHNDAPGRYEADIAGKSLGIGRTDMTLFASQSAHPNAPIAMASAAIAIEITGGVRFAGPMSARWQDTRLLIDVPVSSRTAGHVMMRGTLRAGDDVLAEVSGEADAPEGASTITLDAGSLIAPDDPRATKLALADATAVTRADGIDQWTDFWRGSRHITEGGVR